jgi:hypothetical protein
MCAFEMASCGMIYLPSFMKFGTGVQSSFKVLSQQFECCNVGITNGRDLTKCAVEMGLSDMIYIPSFMKAVTGIQAILRLCFRNLRGCNFGIYEMHR